MPKTGSQDILQDVAHRPWPLPTGPWIMYQRWESLLFAHWRVPAAQLRGLVPAALEIEEFDGSAWLGITPFCLAELRARGLPPLPGASRFLEVNCRTYVRVDDKPGIFFFSLDAESRLAVIAARLGYWLPYRYATMHLERRDGWWHYESHRQARAAAEYVGRYRAVGSTWSPVPGSIEHFLTERYALYAVLGGGVLLRGDIHHRPWRIQRAEARIDRNSLASVAGIALPDAPSLLHYAEEQETLVWLPTPLRP